MTVSQVVDVVLAVMALAVLVLGVATLARARSLVASLELTLARLQSEMTKLVAEASELVDDAELDVSKVEVLLDAAHSANSSLGSASKLAYNAVASPVVKIKALRAGIGRMAMVFRADSQESKGGQK